MCGCLGFERRSLFLLEELEQTSLLILVPSLLLGQPRRKLALRLLRLAPLGRNAQHALGLGLLVEERRIPRGTHRCLGNPPLLNRMLLLLLRRRKAQLLLARLPHLDAQPRARQKLPVPLPGLRELPRLQVHVGGREEEARLDVLLGRAPALGRERERLFKAARRQGELAALIGAVALGRHLGRRSHISPDGGGGRRGLRQRRRGLAPRRVAIRGRGAVRAAAARSALPPSSAKLHLHEFVRVIVGLQGYKGGHVLPWYHM